MQTAKRSSARTYVATERENKQNGGRNILVLVSCSAKIDQKRGCISIDDAASFLCSLILRNSIF
jgi:hypothetical protein